MFNGHDLQGDILHGIVRIFRFKFDVFCRSNSKLLFFDNNYLNPSDPSLLTAKGMILQQRGEDLKALKFYDQALQIKPDMQNAMLNKGIILSKSDKKDEALVCFNQVLELDPLCEMAYCQRAQLYSKNGKEANAMEDLCHAEALSSEINQEKPTMKSQILKRMKTIQQGLVEVTESVPSLIKKENLLDEIKELVHVTIEMNTCR